MGGIHHVGVLVRSIAESLPLYVDLLGLQADTPVEWPELQVRAAFVHAGDDQLELLEPMTPDSPLGTVLAKRGEGLLHICLEVDDLEGTLRRLEGRGVTLVDAHPWTSAIGQVAFLHPKSFHGVSVELWQAGRGHARPVGDPAHAAMRDGDGQGPDAGEIHPGRTAKE